MSDAIQATGSSLSALTERYRTITNNLANADTAGYKARLTTFAAALASQVAGGEPAEGTSDEIVSQVTVDFTPGTLSRTGRTLDMALAGKGFFVLDTPDGQIYTRNGTFRANAQRQLVDVDGRTVAGKGGPIVLPEGAKGIRVARNGTISAVLGDTGTDRLELVGQLKIVEFEDLSVLTPLGSSSFTAPDGVRPKDATAAVVHQGHRELSNVSVVHELVNLISVTRMYEANMKSVAVQDEQAESILSVATS